MARLTERAGIASDAPHPGITMHKIPVKAGFAGVLFTVGSMLIFLIGVPALRWFFALAVVLGIGIALGFRLARHAPRA